MAISAYQQDPNTELLKAEALKLSLLNQEFANRLSTFDLGVLGKDPQKSIRKFVALAAKFSPQLRDVVEQMGAEVELNSWDNLFSSLSGAWNYDARLRDKNPEAIELRQICLTIGPDNLKNLISTLLMSLAAKMAMKEALDGEEYENDDYYVRDIESFGSGSGDIQLGGGLAFLSQVAVQDKIFETSELLDEFFGMATIFYQILSSSGTETQDVFDAFENKPINPESSTNDQALTAEVQAQLIGINQKTQILLDASAYHNVSETTGAIGDATPVGEQLGAESDPESTFLGGIADALANLSEDDAKDLLAKGYLGIQHVSAMATEVAFSILQGQHLLWLALEREIPRPPELLEVWAKDKDWDVRRSVAQNPNCPAVLLAILAKDEAELVRSGVADNPNCPVAVLEKLAKDKDCDVRQSVAKNPNCPIAVLETLAKDKKSIARIGVAVSPNCPLNLLEALAEDKDTDVRRYVPANPNCPVSLLEILEKDMRKETWGVRSGVAESKNCPVAMLEILAKDEDVGVRMGVANNPNCPVSVLKNLAKDTHVYIRQNVAKNPNCPLSLLESLAKTKNNDVRGAVAQNPNCPVAILETFAQDKRPILRRAAAENANCPVAILEVLARDEDPDVRHYGVAQNPNCTAALIETLSCDENEQVRFAAMARIDALVCGLATPEGLRAWIERECQLRQGGNRLSLLSPAKRGENHNVALVRALALCRSDVADGVFAKNQRHPSWLVRSAIARNPKCPDAILTALEKDTHPIVAALAQCNNP